MILTKITTMIRTYSELSRLDTFEDRFAYLVLNGAVGRETFGFDRWMNQEFYRSHEWKQIREFVIVRDNGCDLGLPGYEIFERPLVHHMNPMTPDDVIHGDESIINPEYLITASHQTHNDIHYRGSSSKPKLVVRSSGDTKLW